MDLVPEVLRVDPVGQLRHPRHQLRRDLNVVPRHLVQGPDPQAGPQLDEGEALLAEGPHHAGDEAALGGSAVQLRKKLGVQVAARSG